MAALQDRGADLKDGVDAQPQQADLIPAREVDVVVLVNVVGAAGGAVVAPVEAQLRRLETLLGRRATHVDVHKHLHRHPGVLAKMATTLDITSGGRLELGIGAGWNEEECDAFGIELGSKKERFDRFEEGLAVLQSLFTSDRTTFDGKYYKLTDAMNNPKPLQSPLPVCIGGTGISQLDVGGGIIIRF